MASIKKLFIKYSPDWLFALMWNNIKYRNGVSISRSGNKDWMVSNGYTLISPTPKYTSVGMNKFKEKFEKYFPINKGDVCIDVGACIGDTTVPMLILTGSTGIVYAVEPDSLNIEYLKLNTKRYNNMVIIDKAVWTNDYGKELFLYDTLSGHSLLSRYNKKGSVFVHTDTLDNMFRDSKLDFAKIDIQGAEIDVLSSSNRFLSRVNKLVVECHYNTGIKSNTKDEVIAILEPQYNNVRYSPEYNTVYAWR